jgi:hypothetical protein
MAEECAGGGRAEELAAALRACFAEYVKCLDDYVSRDSDTAGKLTAWLLGNRQFGGLPAHGDFYRKAEALTAELAGALSETPSPELAAATVRWMLSGRLASEKDPAYWMFLAVEGLCEPLLSQCSKPALAEIRDNYRRRLRRTPALPNQKKLARALDTELRKRES